MLKSLPSFRSLIRDECGNVQSTEYILMIVLIAIGGIVGLATLRDQIAQELADTGVALEQLEQTYVIAVPGPGYDPMVAFNQANWIGAGRPATFTGYTVSSYNDITLADADPDADPVGAAPAGLGFSAATVNSEATNAAAASTEGKP